MILLLGSHSVLWLEATLEGLYDHVISWKKVSSVAVCTFFYILQMISYLCCSVELSHGLLAAHFFPPKAFWPSQCWNEKVESTLYFAELYF